MKVTLRNDTPRPLEITGAEGSRLALAPLEARVIGPDVQSDFDFSEAERGGVVAVIEEPPRETAEKIVGLLIGLGMVLAIACGIVAGQEPPAWIGSAAIWKRAVWAAGATLLVLAVGLRAIFLQGSGGLALRVLGQTLALLVILAIGLGLPAATVYGFADGPRLLQESSTELFTRLLQVGFIAIASLLPTLLFFLFDRYQLSTMRNRLYRDLFRLDRGLKTRAEIDAEYGAQIGEAWGPEAQGSGRIAPGTRWPVLVCAVVVTLGWLAAFRPVGALDAAASRGPLAPERNAFAFGFLGAYFFGLQLIARRYARGDLKPKAYGYITIRILTVAVLSWVLEEIFSADSTMKLVMAFLVGILPDEFFTLIREQFRGRLPERIAPEIEKHPLTRLEGIDLYDRARLEQEGIVNVESLAHHDLIHLVLETRIPVPRLVDWLDQAILYLHTIHDGAGATRETLRAHGIRTASDLLTCWDAAAERGQQDAFKQLLGGEGGLSRLEVLRDTLLDDEWLDHILDWRNDADREVQKVEALPTTFEGLVRRAERLAGEQRHQESIDHFEKALKQRDDAAVRLRLARAYAEVPVAKLRDPDLAREHADRALQLGQGDPDLMAGLSEVFERLKEWPAALQACDAGLKALGDPGRDDRKLALQRTLRKRRERIEKEHPVASPA